MSDQLIEGEHFYWEERDNIRYRVFTEKYFIEKRTSCCGNGCRHCIFDPKNKRGSILINQEILTKFGKK